VSDVFSKDDEDITEPSEDAVRVSK
jgi:hypothetical protein